MIPIHFLKRSFIFFWVASVLITFGLISINPTHSYAANNEGLYSGTFSGEKNGSWFLMVKSSGNGQIYFWIPSDKVIDTGAVNINNQGNFTFKCTYELSGTGSIKGDGDLNGNWKSGGMTGSFKGTIQDAEKLKRAAGTYSARCSGSETGELILIVANNGVITGTVTWDKNGLVEEGSGAINSKGSFIFHTQDDTSFYGTIKSVTEVNGEWSNPFWETKGTLGDTPAVKNSSKNVSEAMPIQVESVEEDSNGCFIQTATPN